jgi:ribonuclease BN (tRNA processing enzyme)
LGDVTVQFVGSGDLFGSGGRFQTCIAVRAPSRHVLLDCGASSLPAMQRLGIDPNSVEAIFLTHLHGDHFGGIPFLVLYGQFHRRVAPLVVVGPPGVEERVLQAMEVLFPGSAAAPRRFELRLLELSERTATPVGDVTVTAYEVTHPSGAPAYAVRLDVAGKVVAYSGDGEWSDALIEVAAGADLFIAEAYTFDKPIRYHLSYATLREHRARLRCRRLMLAHMSAEMLGRRRDVDSQVAELGEDGLLVTV